MMVEVKLEGDGDGDATVKSMLGVRVLRRRTIELGMEGAGQAGT